MALGHITCFECGDTGHVAADCPNQAVVAKGGKPPWCGICDERTRLIGLEIVSRCQQCHPLARKALRQFRRCPHCRAVVYEWDNAIDCASHAMPNAAGRRPDRRHIRDLITTGAPECHPSSST